MQPKQELVFAVKAEVQSGYIPCFRLLICMLLQLLQPGLAGGQLLLQLLLSCMICHAIRLTLVDIQGQMHRSTASTGQTKDYVKLKHMHMHSHMRYHALKCKTQTWFKRCNAALRSVKAYTAQGDVVIDNSSIHQCNSL